MSTTFGILKIPVDYDKLVDEDGDLLPYISENVFEPIFFRSMRNSRWLSPIVWALSDDTRVFALDNTHQGIFTIEDCKNLLKQEYDNNSK